VEITNRMGQRALTYVAAVASQGYELTVGEFETYVNLPSPEARPAWSAGRDLEAGGGPGEREPVLDWLTRLGWLTRRDGKVSISPLGRAVLRAVEQRERQASAPPEVSLGLPEPFAYGPVLARMADLRDALLVDRTFQLDQLLDVVLRTSVTRILIGGDHQYEGERRRLAAAIARPLGIDRPLFIGVSGELHDRFVIPPSGPVGFLAASRSGGGERIPVLGAVQPPAADAIRRAFEDVWARATPLVAGAGGYSQRERPFPGRPLEMPPSVPQRDLPAGPPRPVGMPLADLPEPPRERDLGLPEQLLGGRVPEERTMTGPPESRPPAPAYPQGRHSVPQPPLPPAQPPLASAPPPRPPAPAHAAEDPAERERRPVGDPDGGPPPPLRERVLGREAQRPGRDDERRPPSVLHTLRSLVTPPDGGGAPPEPADGRPDHADRSPPGPPLEPPVPIGNHTPRSAPPPPTSQPPQPPPGQRPNGGDQGGVPSTLPPWLPPAPWSPPGPPPRQAVGEDLPTTQTWRVEDPDNGHQP